MKIADEKGRPNLLFQFFDALAESRLGAAHAFGSASEIVLVYDCQKMLKVEDFHKTRLAGSLIYQIEKLDTTCFLTGRSPAKGALHFRALTRTVGWGDAAGRCTRTINSISTQPCVHGASIRGFDRARREWWSPVARRERESRHRPARLAAAGPPCGLPSRCLPGTRIA